MAYVRDVMKKESVTAKVTDGVKHISKILARKKISNMPVVNAKNELVGIVSEKDIIRAMEAEKFLSMKALDIMTTNVLSVKESDSLEYVSKIFIGKPYRRLPVTRDKKVVGVITREEIIKSFMNDYY
jgi:acetoin utilization protein AcuB